MIGVGEQLRKHGLPNQTTVPATSAELLLLWFCGARNTEVKIELGEDELNIVFFLSKLHSKFNVVLKWQCHVLKCTLNVKKKVGQMTSA